jgi:Ca-activated chloride channel family protein
MKDANNPIRIRARWDHNELPTGEANQRGLLLEIETDKPIQKEKKKRPALNLAIVIDRSGSMQQGRLEAAKEAAIGIVNRLSWHDHLSVVIYDQEVSVLVDGQRQDRETRPMTCEKIQSIRCRGMTNLSDGWLRGARCVADVMDREDIKAGHVILLSDGHANVGETDPEALGKLAGDLAARGVTSSCVGIGNNYSPLQLNAIAEAGEGEMHHSDQPGEIIEVVMGELGEATQVVARNFSVSLQLPRRVTARQLTNYRGSDAGHNVECFLGSLIGGQQRRLAFLVDLPEFTEPEALTFRCTANWLDAETAMEEHTIKKEFELLVVPAHTFDEDKRNKDVARAIADIWMASHGYQAMMLNERGLYEEASRIFDADDERFARMTAGLAEATEMKRQRSKSRESVASEWHGASKLEALSMSRKASRGKPDFRRQRSESKWTDFKPEK